MSVIVSANVCVGKIEVHAPTGRGLVAREKATFIIDDATQPLKCLELRRIMTNLFPFIKMPDRQPGAYAATQLGQPSPYHRIGIRVGAQHLEGGVPASVEVPKHHHLVVVEKLFHAAYSATANS